MDLYPISMRIYIFRTRSHECIDSWPLWAFISAITQCLLALRHQSRSYQNNNDKQFSATNSNHYFQCTRLSSRTMPRYFVRLKRAKQKLLFSLGLSFCLVWFSAWCPPPKQQQKSSKKKNNHPPASHHKTHNMKMRIENVRSSNAR